MTPQRASTKNHSWNRRLLEIPTLFGRLVFVSSLRDSAGLYQEIALSTMLGPNEAQRVLSQAHREIFSEWLALGLAAKKSDLETYLAAAAQDLRAPLSAQWFQQLIPLSAQVPEQQLYLADLETLLERWRYGSGPAVSRQGA